MVHPLAILQFVAPHTGDAVAMEDLKRISTGQWCGSTWQKASPIWDHLTVPEVFRVTDPAHAARAGLDARGLGRHDEDRSCECNHRRTHRERRGVPPGASPAARSASSPSPAPRLRKRDSRRQSKCVRSPRRARLTVPSAPSLFLPQADIRNSAEMELANVVSVPRRPAPPFPPRPRETPRPS